MKAVINLKDYCNGDLMKGNEYCDRIYVGELAEQDNPYSKETLNSIRNKVQSLVSCGVLPRVNEVVETNEGVNFPVVFNIQRVRYLSGCNSEIHYVLSPK